MSNKSSRPSSIQASNLDLTALGDALTDSPIDDSNSQKDKSKHQVSEAEPYSLGDDEDDDDQEEEPEETKAKAKDEGLKSKSNQDDKKLQQRDSPETLSPDSSPLKKDNRPLRDEKSNSVTSGTDSKVTKDQERGDGGAATATERRSSSIRQETENKDSDQVEAIKNMFPDLDSETISAVLVGTNGDVDAAINHLLSMSDPNYVPPPPSETDSDAALARSLAAEQEQSLNRQHRPSGRGGSQPPSLGGRFGGNQSPSQQQQPQQPTYNPNALNYQPRQRKTPPNPNARAAYNASTPPITSQAANHNPLVAGFPGSNEAKQWEESINKFAETGMAKAASTFAALRTRAAALASSPTSEGGPSNNGNSSGSSSNPSSSGAGSFFSQFGLGGGQSNNGNGNNSSSIGGSFNRKQSQNPRSPQSPYDKDPEPVGEDELARILARGQASRSSSTSSSIGLGTGRGSSSGKSQWRDKQDVEDDLDDDDLWGGAGKVIDKKKKKSIVGNENASSDDTTVNAKKEDFKPIEIKGAGVDDEKNQSSIQNHRSNDREDSDENDSDVEYVANPFEEDD